MSSKLLPWDFFKKNPTVFDIQDQIFLVLEVKDPFVLSKAMDRLEEGLFPKGKRKIEVGEAINLQWIDQNLGQANLFESSLPIIILNAEKINKNGMVALVERMDTYSEAPVLLIFSKDSPLLKDLKKRDTISFKKIDNPTSWDGSKILKWLSGEMDLHLNFEVNELILDRTESTIAALVKVLTLIKVELGNQEVTLEGVRQLLKRDRWDQFEVAEHFSTRSFGMFGEKLLEQWPDYNTYFVFFRFMQNHLLKMSDHSYLELKKKESGYDRKIQTQSQRWNKVTLEKYARLFGQWEILAKKRDPLLKTKIQRLMIRV